MRCKKVSKGEKEKECVVKNGIEERETRREKKEREGGREGTRDRDNGKMVKSDETVSV